MTAADSLPADPLLHLLRRAAYGPTPAAVAEIRKLGAAAWRRWGAGAGRTRHLDAEV